MNIDKRTLLSAAVCGVFAAPMAFAQVDEALDAEVRTGTTTEIEVPVDASDASPTWAELDADADGRISAAEAAVDAAFSAGFMDTDADGDGFVTEAEFDAQAEADLDPR